MPTTARSSAEMLMRRAGRAFLVLTGTLAIVQGISYLPWFAPDPLPGVLRLLTEAGFSTLLWAAAWVAVGLLALAGIPRVWMAGSVMAITASYAWGLIYLLAFIQVVVAGAPLNRDWFSARTYLLGLGGLSSLFLWFYGRVTRALWGEPTTEGK